jgi:hypothetical protein
MFLTRRQYSNKFFALLGRARNGRGGRETGGEWENFGAKIVKNALFSRRFF